MYGRRRVRLDWVEFQMEKSVFVTLKVEQMHGLTAA